MYVAKGQIIKLFSCKTLDTCTCNVCQKFKALHLGMNAWLIPVNI